jgi:hypothetical protein
MHTNDTKTFPSTSLTIATICSFYHHPVIIQNPTQNPIFIQNF